MHMYTVLMAIFTQAKMLKLPYIMQVGQLRDHTVFNAELLYNNCDDEFKSQSATVTSTVNQHCISLMKHTNITVPENILKLISSSLSLLTYRKTSNKCQVLDIGQGSR